jgi:hypothetical protein
VGLARRRIKDEHVSAAESSDLLQLYYSDPRDRNAFLNNPFAAFRFESNEDDDDNLDRCV